MLCRPRIEISLCLDMIENRKITMYYWSNSNPAARRVTELSLPLLESYAHTLGVRSVFCWIRKKISSKHRWWFNRNSRNLTEIPTNWSKPPTLKNHQNDHLLFPKSVYMLYGGVSMGIHEKSTFTDFTENFWIFGFGDFLSDIGDILLKSIESPPLFGSEISDEYTRKHHVPLVRERSFTMVVRRAP